MRERTDQIVLLISKYLRNELSSEENELLQQWLSEDEKNRELLNLYTDDNLMTNEMRLYAKYDRPQMWEKILQHVNGTQKAVHATPMNTYPKIKKPSRVFAFAATVVVLLSVVYIAYNSRDINKKNRQPVPTPSDNARDTTGLPGNIPSLTLADGSKINLLEANNGLLHQQGAYKIYKHNNEIKYEPGEWETGDSEMYNTLSATAGTRFNVVLPDGSKALLNVASSIRFAVSSTMLRTVDMTGEAEFEVIPDEKKPFRVNINQPSGKHLGAVEVTGTTFNINAYEEEECGKITLLDGTMKVFPAQVSVIENKPIAMANPERELKPGQQAQLRDGRISVISDVDTAAITAWKKGILQYNSIPTRKLLSKLEKWYGIEVDYALSAIPDCIHYVTITPDLTFETVMEGLKVQCPQLYIRIKSK